MTAGLCEQACQPEISEENIIFKSNADTLISREDDNYNDNDNNDNDNNNPYQGGDGEFRGLLWSL